MVKQFIFTILFSFIATSVFADNWLEKDLASLPKDTKIEIVKMYNDIHQKAAKLRVNIVETSNDLAKAIEKKVNSAKQELIVDKLTNQIVDLSNDIRIAYTDLSNKAGSLSQKFEKEKAGDDDADDFYNKFFTSDGVEDIYDLLDDSGLPTPTKKEIMEKYGIKHISFASIYDNDNHINVLVSINPVKKYAAKEILKDVAVCFSISIHNKNYLNKTESEAVRQLEI